MQGRELAREGPKSVSYVVNYMSLLIGKVHLQVSENICTYSSHKFSNTKLGVKEKMIAQFPGNSELYLGILVWARTSTSKSPMNAKHPQQVPHDS